MENGLGKNAKFLGQKLLMGRKKLELEWEVFNIGADGKWPGLKKTHWIFFALFAIKL